MPLRLLLVNPNRSGAMTDAMLATARSVAPPGVDILAATDADGPETVSADAVYDRVAIAVVPFALGAIRRLRVDGVLLACFGDPGLAALSARASVPAVGLAVGAMTEATRRGRFGIVTGRGWRDRLAALAEANGCARSLAGIVELERPAPEIVADPEAGRSVLADAVRRCAAGGAEVVILGGGAFAGLAADVAQRSGVPTLDCVAAATRELLAGVATARSG